MIISKAGNASFIVIYNLKAARTKGARFLFNKGVMSGISGSSHKCFVLDTKMNYFITVTPVLVGYERLLPSLEVDCNRRRLFCDIKYLKKL